jgi:hypothetical protein
MKSKPKSIRFDEEKLDFAKKHLKKDSAQKVVDYLLDSVWWRNQAIELPESMRSNPITVEEAYPPQQVDDQIIEDIEKRRRTKTGKKVLLKSETPKPPIDTPEGSKESPSSSYLDSLTPLQRKKLGL